jgi:hypothetical protein
LLPPQAAMEVTLGDWQVLAGLPLLEVLHLAPANLVEPQPAQLLQLDWQQQLLLEEGQQEGQQGGAGQQGGQAEHQHQHQQAAAAAAAGPAAAAAAAAGLVHFPLLQELAVTLPVAQLQRLAALTGLTQLELTPSDRASSTVELGALLQQLSPLRQLRCLQLLRKASLPCLVHLSPTCLGQLQQLWPALQQLVLHVQTPQPPSEAWQAMRQLAQLKQLALVNTSPQPAWLCPSQLPAGLLQLQLANVGLASGGSPVAQALSALQELKLCSDGDEWEVGQGCELVVGSRLQALELDQVGCC